MGTRAHAQSSTTATNAAWRGPLWPSSASWERSVPENKRQGQRKAAGRGGWQEGLTAHQVGDDSQRPEQQLCHEAAEGEVLVSGGDGVECQCEGTCVAPKPAGDAPGRSDRSRCIPAVCARRARRSATRWSGRTRRSTVRRGQRKQGGGRRRVPVSVCQPRLRRVPRPAGVPSRLVARTTRCSTKQATVRAVEAAWEGRTRDAGALPCPLGAGRRRVTAMAARAPGY